MLKMSGEFNESLLQGSLAEGSQERLRSQTMSQTMPSYASATTASAVSASQAKPHRLNATATAASSTAPTSANAKNRPRISREEAKGGTWKSHVASQREHDKDKVNGRDFVAMDDYLRGGTDAVTDRKNRERERLARQRNDGNLLEGSAESAQRLGSPQFNRSVNSSTDRFGQSMVGANGGRNVYHGKILLAV
jgi:hypothetical protein